MSGKSVCDDCLNSMVCPMQAGITREACAFYDAKSEAAIDVAKIFVTWDWLAKYAEGKRSNFCSDFVSEAKQAFVQEVRERYRREEQ